MLLDNHLGLYPSFETVDVYDGAGAFAVAGGNEKIVVSLILPKANLALAMKVFLDFVSFMVFIFIFAIRECLFGSLELRDDILNSAQLDDISNL